MDRKKRKVWLAGLLAIALCLTSLLGGTQVTAQAKTPKTVHYLFVGNSITYYNNMPEMFGQIASAGTGRKVEVSTLVYAGRTLETHYKAVKAVIRTKGNPARLTSGEKQYFVTYKDQKYNAQVYKDYAKSILDKKGKVIKYDYIVMQDHKRDHSYSSSKNGVFGLTKTFGGKNTTIVLFMPNIGFNTKGSVKGQKPEQDKHNAITKRVGKALKDSKLKFKGVKVAYPGNAFFNYMFYYGTNHAIKADPKDYAIYKKEKAYTGNDLFVKGDLHATQLGSYLMAATLYSTIYKESAASTVKSYQATTSSAVKVPGKSPGQNYALKNGAFRNKALLKHACYIADQTANHGMNLKAAR